MAIRRTRKRLDKAALAASWRSSLGLYVLRGHMPVPIESVEAWAEWFERSFPDRTVARTEIQDGAVAVSTVFLGIDHGRPSSKRSPLLFETMVFGGSHDHECWRWKTWEAAEGGHALIVRQLQEEAKTQ